MYKDDSGLLIGDNTPTALILAELTDRFKSISSRQNFLKHFSYDTLLLRRIHISENLCLSLLF